MIDSAITPQPINASFVFAKLFSIYAKASPRFTARAEG
jgi:hypothetical protein